MTRIPIIGQRSWQRISTTVKTVEGQGPLEIPGPPGRSVSGQTHIRIRNGTGTVLKAGTISAFGAVIDAAAISEFPGVQAKQPVALDWSAFALIPSPIPVGADGIGQIHGAGLVNVDIVQEFHTHCDIVAGSWELRSHVAGSARIIAKDAAGTGVKRCLVALKTPPEPVFFGTAGTGGITAGGSGDAILSLTSGDLETVTVQFPYMHGDEDISEGKDVAVVWQVTRFVVLGADCE